MAAAKGLEMREIDLFDGEFEEQSLLGGAPRPVWDSRVVAIGTTCAISEYPEFDGVTTTWQCWRTQISYSMHHGGLVLVLSGPVDW